MRRQSDLEDVRLPAPPPLRIDRQTWPARFLVVSNRLPYNISVENDRIVLVRGIGGLVTALDPVLRLTGGTWVGWSGSTDPLPDAISIDAPEQPARGYHLSPITLSRREVDEYYLGYSNRCLWPLFHYFQEHCDFDEKNWATYRDVNRRFADAVAAAYRPGDMVWVHDYHLLLVPRLIRERIPGVRVGLFLHIPFPAGEIFRIDDHSVDLLRGMLGSDLIGFHTDGYVDNFIDSVTSLTGHEYSSTTGTVRVDDRRVALGSFPISVDCEQFQRMAERPGIEDEIRRVRDAYRAEIIALGVDRLDYTKGILERLQAIELMLERHPDIQGRFTFVQLSAPSRTKVHAYREMREKIEYMVGRINGRFGGRGCIPIDYRYEEHSHEELAAFYRAADLVLVTPLRDGMNLVAKEYVVCRPDEDGVLVLSRFAGAFDELKDAVAVNPYHPEDMAEAIYQATRMPAAERRRRMRQMRATVARNDIYAWLGRFLLAIGAGPIPLADRLPGEQLAAPHRPPGVVDGSANWRA
jgi:trehalose 6-phosphate synthase/phosphatase